MNAFDLVCSLLLVPAIVHTFLTKYFEHLARRPKMRQAGSPLCQQFGGLTLTTFAAPPVLSEPGRPRHMAK